jgi:hypothetical protein
MGFDLYFVGQALSPANRFFFTRTDFDRSPMLSLCLARSSATVSFP